MGFLRTRRLSGMCGVLVISLMLAACGAGDGDDPTATVPPSDAQPTVATTEEADVAPQESPVDLAGTAAPTNIDMSTIPSAGTPASADDGIATPESGSTQTEEVSGSTPLASPAVSSDSDGTSAATANDDTNSVESGTPVSAEDGTQGDAAVGDGTTGATIPDLDGTPSASPELADAATPEVLATPQTGATPEASASPAAALAVTGCEVGDVPPYTGDQTTFTLTTDLNFRTGPGSECDLALDVPLGEFQQVIVVGGPVVRTDDGSEWVQIQVGETIGWVAFEFLAPVE